MRLSILFPTTPLLMWHLPKYTFRCIENTSEYIYEFDLRAPLSLWWNQLELCMLSMGWPWHLLRAHLAGRSSSWGVRRWGRSLGGTRGRCRRYCRPAGRNVGRPRDEQWTSAPARGSARFGSHSPVRPISVVSSRDRMGHPGGGCPPSPVPRRGTHQAHADGAVSI